MATPQGAGPRSPHQTVADLPARIAEYVVVHEMAHLLEPHHTPEFWRRVERAMPDCEMRKAWLAQRGAAVEGLVPLARSTAPGHAPDPPAVSTG